MSERDRRGLRCGVCGGPVGARAGNPAFPFCRVRCRQIDLGRWLGGDYVISRPLSPEDELGEWAGAESDAEPVSAGDGGGDGEEG